MAKPIFSLLFCIAALSIQGTSAVYKNTKKHWFHPNASSTFSLVKLGNVKLRFLDHTQLEGYDGEDMVTLGSFSVRTRLANIWWCCCCACVCLMQTPCQIFLCMQCVFFFFCRVLFSTLKKTRGSKWWCCTMVYIRAVHVFVLSVTALLLSLDVWSCMEVMRCSHGTMCQKNRGPFFIDFHNREKHSYFLSYALDVLRSTPPSQWSTLAYLM